MRLAAVAALASLAVVVPGDFGTATYAGTTLSLRLRYPMICGQPGPGPLVVRLPTAFRLTQPRVRVDGSARPFSVAVGTLTIRLPKPPEVTCMSIAEGALPVLISGVRAPTGSYVLRASLSTHAFTARLRVR